MWWHTLHTGAGSLSLSKQNKTKCKKTPNHGNNKNTVFFNRGMLGLSPHPRPGLMLRSSWHTKTNSAHLGRRSGGYSLLLCVCFFLMGSGDGTQSPTPSSKCPTDWAISPAPVCFSCSSSYQSRNLLKTHPCFQYGLLALRMVLSMIGVVIRHSMICGRMTGCVFNDDLIEFCP